MYWVGSAVCHPGGNSGGHGKFAGGGGVTAEDESQVRLPVIPPMMNSVVA